MKKSILSFIIPLALFSLAVFAVVGVPERVVAQVSTPVLGSFSVSQFSPPYIATTTGSITIHSVLGFFVGAQGSNIILGSIRVGLGTTKQILANSSVLYITDKKGIPLTSLPINANNVVLDGYNYVVIVPLSLLVQKDTSSAFVIAVDKANPDATFSIPANGIRGVDESGVSSFAPIQSIPDSVYSIDVLSPNGGETIPTATALPVVWTENYAVNPIIIRITDSAGKEFYSGKTSGVVGKNMQTLQPEATNVPPGKYKVTICDADGLPFEPCDSSDNYFTIGSTTTCYTFIYNLTLGSRDTPGRRDDVTHLQNFLLSKGFSIHDLTLNDPADKGYFGFATFQALKKYQESVGIQATGYFGPETRAKVNGECVSMAPSIVSVSPERGISGTEVKVVTSNFKTGPGYTYYVAFLDPVTDSGATATLMGNGVLSFKVPHLAPGIYKISAGAYSVEGSDTGYTKSFTILPPNQASSSASIMSSSRTTSPNPTITGKASGASAVGITLSNSGGKVYGSGLIPVTNGTWSTTVSPALAAGQYTVTVYDANNKVLTTGILTVIYTTTPPPTATSTITVLPWTASSTDGFTSVLAGNYLGYSLNWSGGPMGDPNYMIFVHFVNRTTGATFVADFSPTTPISSWSGNISTPNGIVIPAGTAQGTYDVYVGIYRGPTRLTLTAGPGVIAENDGGLSNRYKVGSINVIARTVTANVSSAGLPIVRTPNASASIWNALKSLFAGQ